MLSSVSMASTAASAERWPLVGAAVLLAKVGTDGIGEQQIKETIACSVGSSLERRDDTGGHYVDMVSGLIGHVRKGGLIDAKQQLWADGAACKLAERGLTDQDHGLRLRTEHTTHGAVALQRVPYQRVIVNLTGIVLAELLELVAKTLAVASLGRASFALDLVEGASAINCWCPVANLPTC